MAEIVLGIDPGANTTGFGIVLFDAGEISYLASNVIETPAKDASLVDRLLHIHDSIRDVIRDYRPTHCAVEDVFYHKNPKSALTLGQARGAAILAAAQASVPVTSYPAKEIKKAITGNGAAHKSQVLAMLQRLLVLPDVRDDNESDGIAVSYCHAARLGLKRREQRIEIW